MLSILNICFMLPTLGVTALECVGIITFTVVFEVAINGVFAWLVHSLPKKWFLPEHKFFKVHRGERKFYEKIGIKKWKDKVWELGALGGFRKNKINDPSSPDYFTLFLIESNKGIMVHIAGVFVSFLCILLYPAYALTIGLPASIVGVILNILPIFVLRYNIPKLEVARERARRNKERDTKQSETSQNTIESPKTQETPNK